MKSSAKKVELASVDDLFTTEQERQQAGEERVVRIPLSQLHYFKGYPAMQTEVPFAGQPYRVKDDDPKMLETLDSIRQRGVRTPGLVRPDPDGGYEIISGHRRHRASELAGLEDMPVIIREMNDEEAVIEMVDANIQREDVLPSEKAWAYRMKLEAIKRQGERTDLTSAQVGPKLTAAEKIAENSPDSKSQVKRYIRLTAGSSPRRSYSTHAPAAAPAGAGGSPCGAAYRSWRSPPFIGQAPDFSVWLLSCAAAPLWLSASLRRLSGGGLTCPVLPENALLYQR